MESNNSRRRGRPATGRKKDGVIFIRVPKGMEDKCREAVYLALGGCATAKEIPPMRSLDHTLAKAATSECIKQEANIKALLEDVERLTKELEYWKERFEKAVNATEAQMATYWKDRAIKAEKYAASLNQS
jgi:hypothetical protein